MAKIVWFPPQLKSNPLTSPPDTVGEVIPLDCIAASVRSRFSPTIRGLP